MRRGLWFAAVLALALATAASAGSAATGGRIVFPATPDGSTIDQLYSITPSGSDLKQITTGAYPAHAPSFSPNGKRIVFVRAGVGIFTMNPDGTGLKRLTTSLRDAFPTWSPDGKKIAFVRPIGPAWKIFIMPAAGGKPKVLAKAPPAGRPSWTKKGLLIPTGGDLVRVDTKTGKVLKYYGANVDAIWGLNSVSISPSLKLLTYVGTRDPIPGDQDCGDGPCQRFGLYLENLTTKKKVSKLYVKDTGPAAWSPDGKNIVFVSGGALVVKPVGSGSATSIPIEGATPITSSPPSWR